MQAEPADGSDAGRTAAGGRSGRATPRLGNGETPAPAAPSERMGHRHRPRRPLPIQSTVSTRGSEADRERPIPAVQGSGPHLQLDEHSGRGRRAPAPLDADAVVWNV